MKKLDMKFSIFGSCSDGKVRVEIEDCNSRTELISFSMDKKTFAEALFGLANRPIKVEVATSQYHNIGKYCISKSLEVENHLTYNATEKDCIEMVKKEMKKLGLEDWIIWLSGFSKRYIYKDNKTYLDVTLIKYVDEKPKK